MSEALVSQRLRWRTFVSTSLQGVGERVRRLRKLGKELTAKRGRGVACLKRESFPSHSRQVSDGARSLNDILYSDFRSIPADFSHFIKTMEAHCKSRGYTKDYTQSWTEQQAHRLYLTLGWLEDLVKTHYADGCFGLELGGETIVTDLLKLRFPSVSWRNTKGDLRYYWRDVSDQSFDLVVCTEILEHLSDLPEGFQEDFRKTGLLAVIKECHRALRPGGHMLITTPNATSVVHLRGILSGYAPWHYDLHVREYTPGELLDKLKHVGFQVERWKTVHCLTAFQEIDYTPLFQMLLDYGLPTADRGDDIFIVACKP